MLNSNSAVRALTSNVSALMHAIWRRGAVVACVYHSTKFGFEHILGLSCLVDGEGIREMKSGGVVQVVYLERRIIGKKGRGVNGGVLMMVKVCGCDDGDI
jgi:hypothetical protein